ncbi:unnamed protein product [Rotaria socialis]|uniref:Aminopeptidase n=1 Tax=Rotaria socialis TaxID=392032 RepID=A0A818WSY9_9BILA|nr:unnamed protein product [Rotaria socialis]CAF4638614.1 unnamed protein product [Rotaria socialis]
MKKEVFMANSKDDAILLGDIDHQRSFLHKKVNLTVPICTLLIVVFLSSAFFVSIVSLYWAQDIKCYVDSSELIKPDEPKPRQVYYSRPKRSVASRKANVPCFEFGCCTTPLDPSKPWSQSRLPKNVYPNEYQLTLDLFELNEGQDKYSGTVDIVLEVRSPTYDIILHGEILISDVIVTKRASPDNIPLTVDCVLPFPDTQTLTIHLKEQLQVGDLYDVRISFFRALSVHGTGIFEIPFATDPSGLNASRIILTHFKPVHAREAFPCFDEPDFKAKFELTVRHENDTTILSNWDESESFPDENYIQTEFQTVPAIPTSLIAFSIFYTEDFDKKTVIATYPDTGRQIRINLWARKQFFTNGNGTYIDEPLEMLRVIFTALLNIFQEIKTTVVPTQINVLAVPEYPSDAVSHWGFIIIHELSILHSQKTTSASEHQEIALILAKQLAEQWCGNLISFRWWTDLWLQEALSNYLKYQAINIAYPEWNIKDQFYTGELLKTMFDDSLSVSHPIQKSVNSRTDIDALFDSIEVTKTTAIFKMADYYMEQTTGIKDNTLAHLVSFLRDNEYGFFIPDEIISTFQIGPWKGPEFFDRWLLQPNFPQIFADFVRNGSSGNYIFRLIQYRHLSEHMYEYDLYPPETTPFDYVWYVPITCRFSNDSTTFSYNQTFYLDRSTMNVDFGNVYYNYFYCNTDFAGYYIMDYTSANWEELAEALDNDNAQITEKDRANLINNAFLSAQTTEESYRVVRSVTQFFFRSAYSGLLPWQVLSYHANRMLDVLEYESLFDVVQKYFQLVVRNYYRDNEVSLWNDQGTFSEHILKTIIIQLACRTRLNECIDKATTVWDEGYPDLANGLATHSIVAHARDVVYQTNFQNSYNDSEWITIEASFYMTVDVQERFRLLKGLLQSRQPWHLYQFLYEDADYNSDLNVDLLEVLILLAKNPVGRELAWYYYRNNWSKLQETYERTNQRLGQLLIEITATFEDEFHSIELNGFLALTPGVDANVDARFWALERTNMNFWWIVDNSEDMAESFGLDVKNN